MVGTGATAVFFRDVEAGPTALIAIGAVLLVMSVTGSPITRAKFGDNEVELALRRREAVIAIESAPPEETASALEVMSVYDPTSGRSPTVLNALRRNLKNEVRRFLRENFPPEQVTEDAAPWDYSVELNGKHVVLKCLYDDSVHVGRRLREATQRFLDSEHRHGIIITYVPNMTRSIRLRDTFRLLADRAEDSGKKLRILPWYSGDEAHVLEAFHEIAIMDESR